MFLLIDKPKGLTSFDVVAKLRKITGEKKIGHSGTLDPLASGLLIVGIGRDSTKKLNYFLREDKEYEAHIVLGEERTTDDAWGEKRNTVFEKIIPSKKEVSRALNGFLGEIEQVPPSFSAIKISGEKAYNAARSGKEFILKPRKVVVYLIKLLGYEYPDVFIYCKVSSGTYIRSLARDLGRLLKTGAYVKELRRLAIGKCKVSEAVGLDKINFSNWKIFAKNYSDLC